MKLPGILLIDGDLKRRNDFASRLRVIGYDVELADGGFHAIHLIEKVEYFCLIVLEDMQDMSGNEIITHARTHKEKLDLPIIYISRTTDQGEVLHAFESGANDFIVYSPKCFNSISEKLKKFSKTAK